MFFSHKFALLAFIHGEDARLGKLDHLLLGAHDVVAANSQSGVVMETVQSERG